MERADIKAVYCLLEHGRVTKKTEILCAWQKKDMQSISDAGIIIGQYDCIRIPKTSDLHGFCPKIGAMIVSMGSDDATALTDVDLKKRGAITIAAIADNTTGSAPHWKITGYTYGNKN